MGTSYRLPEKVTLSDLTVRDGFQSEQRVIPAEGKLFISKQPLPGV